MHLNAYLIKAGFCSHTSIIFLPCVGCLCPLLQQYSGNKGPFGCNMSLLYMVLIL